MNTLENWLKNTCGCHDVRACRVTIDGETWEGCYYRQTLPYGQCDAVARGEKKATDTYTREMIYCVGKLPKCYKHNRDNRVCFTGTETRDWYIAGYMHLQTTTAVMARYHPFGVSFLLSPWDIPGTKIDDHEPKPYRRLPMAVEYIFSPLEKRITPGLTSIETRIDSRA